MIGERSTEFLVIGGGPAGSAAAISLAKAGRDVIIVERSGYRGIRIGETLPSFAKPVLHRLGVCSEEILKFSLGSPGTSCSWGSDSLTFSDAIYDPDGEGLHVDRTLFDSTLASLAEKSGATIMRHTRVVSGRAADLGWQVTIDGPCGSQTILAKQLIDAAGRTGWSGRPGRRHSFDKQIAFVGYFERNKKLNCLDQRTWIEAIDFGWWYSAMIPDNRYVAAFFSDADLVRGRGNNRDQLWKKAVSATRWIRERLQGTLLENVRVVSASSTLVTPIVLDRYIAIGDAASTFDPLSSQGVNYALTTAISAAEALLHSEKNDAIRRYARRVTEQFFADLHTRMTFCRLETRWADSPFWRRRHGIRHEVESSRSSGTYS